MESYGVFYFNNLIHKYVHHRKVKQKTFDTTKKIQSKAELHPAKQVVVNCMRSKRWARNLCLHTWCCHDNRKMWVQRDLQHTKPSFPERNCENKGTSCGRRFPLLFGLWMRERNNWEKQKLKQLSHSPFLSPNTVSHTLWNSSVLAQAKGRKAASLCELL